MDFKAMGVSQRPSNLNEKSKQTLPRLEARTPDIEAMPAGPGNPLRRLRSKSQGQFFKVRFDDSKPPRQGVAVGTPRDRREKVVSVASGEAEPVQTPPELVQVVIKSTLREAVRKAAKSVGEDLTSNLGNMIDFQTSSQHDPYQDKSDKSGIDFLTTRFKVTTCASTKSTFDHLPGHIRQKPIVALALRLGPAIADRMIEQIVNLGANPRNALDAIHRDRGQAVSREKDRETLMQRQKAGELVKTSLQVQERKEEWCSELGLTYEQANALLALADECANAVATQHQILSDGILAGLEKAAGDDMRIVGLVRNLLPMLARKIAHELTGSILPQVERQKGDLIVAKRRSSTFKPVFERKTASRRTLVKDPTMARKRLIKSATLDLSKVEGHPTSGPGAPRGEKLERIRELHNWRCKVQGIPPMDFSGVQPNDT